MFRGDCKDGGYVVGKEDPYHHLPKMTNFYDMAHDTYSFDQDEVTIQESETAIIAGKLDLDPFLFEAQNVMSLGRESKFDFSIDY